MKITVEVVLYTGAHKNTVYIELSEEDLKDLAERKAGEENYCDSCYAKELVLQVNV